MFDLSVIKVQQIRPGVYVGEMHGPRTLLVKPHFTITPKKTLSIAKMDDAVGQKGDLL